MMPSVFTFRLDDDRECTFQADYCYEAYVKAFDLIGDSSMDFVHFCQTVQMTEQYIDPTIVEDEPDEVVEGADEANKRLQNPFKYTVADTIDSVFQAGFKLGYEQGKKERENEKV